MQSGANPSDPCHEQQQRRAAVLGKWKERVVKSASSLAKQCGVPVAVFSPRVGDGKDAPPVLCWPSKPEVGVIATRYYALPEKDRTKQSVHAASHLEDLLQAAAKSAKESVAAAKSAKGGATVIGLLGDMPEDELRVLLRSLDESVAAASDRIRPKPQPQTVEEIEQELMREYADKFMVDSQDDVVVDDSASQLDMVIAKESSMVEVQPPDVVAGAGAEEEAKLSKGSVESITEKPNPYTRVEDMYSFRYYKDGIEYVNLGGNMIERDVFESVWREHGMATTPSLEPELLDDEDYDLDCYGYPLVPAHLWPWTCLPLPFPLPP